MDWYRLTERVGQVLLGSLAVRRRWHGLENLPAAGSVLLASNHVSFPDFVFIGEAALGRGRDVRFMCRHDVWHSRLVARAMDGMGHIPVDREAPAAAYLHARRLLRQGEAVCAFPEAGVSWSFTVRSLMRGVASLARETGVPVVPVGIWGSQRFHTVGRRADGGRRPPDLARGRVVDVCFGEPMTAAPGEDLTAWTQALGAVLADQLEALQLLPGHRPRPGEVAPWYPAHLGGHAPTREQARELDVVPRSAVAPTWGPYAVPRPDRQTDRRPGG